mgnify:CR=1 FL=1
MAATTESLDVIIIGAGAAGLTAAFDFHYTPSNLSHKVLEASSKLGGRLQKLTGFADFPIDVGGEWIHKPPTVLDDIYDADSSDPEKPTSDIETTAYVKTYDEWDDNEWVTQAFDSQDFKFVNYTWFDYFDEWIAPSLNIEYDCAVTRLDWSASPVQVECANGKQFTAQHVIVTASMGVLQKDDIQFVPALPADIQSAINTYWMMSGLKVFMKFEERFYREAFEFASDFQRDGYEKGERYFYNVAYGQTTENNVLGVFQVGDPATRFLTMTDQEIYDDILQQLDGVYDGQATPNFVEGFVQNWNEQLFVKGAYTDLSDDDDELNGIEVMRQSLDDRVFFAGEAIPASGYEYGFAHEAAFSGRAAAAKVVTLLKGGEPSGSDSNTTSSAFSARAMSTSIQHCLLSFGLLALCLTRKLH